MLKLQVWYENFLEDEWEQKLNKYHIKNLLLYEKIFVGYDPTLLKHICDQAIKDFDCEYINIYKFYSQVSKRIIAYICILYRTYMKRYTKIQNLANNWTIYKLYNPNNGKKFLVAKAKFEKMNE